MTSPSIPGIIAEIASKWYHHSVRRRVGEVSKRWQAPYLAVLPGFNGLQPGGKLSSSIIDCQSGVDDPTIGNLPSNYSYVIVSLLVSSLRSTTTDPFPKAFDTFLKLQAVLHSSSRYTTSVPSISARLSIQYLSPQDFWILTEELVYTSMSIVRQSYPRPDPTAVLCELLTLT